MFSITITAKELGVPIEEFRLKALAWADTYPHVAYYNPNQVAYPHQGFDHLLAVSASSLKIDEEAAFESLQQLLQQEPLLLCGFLTYDLKNQIEALTSYNPDKLGFPPVHFFAPEVYFYFNDDAVSIYSISESIQSITTAVLSASVPRPATPADIQIQQRVSKEEYLQNVEQVRELIREGDVYELNYCIEFFAEEAQVAPLPLYLALNQASPTPFSGYFKLEDKYLLCASPERFLKKEESLLISQPIKGTIRRGTTPEEDIKLKQQLRQDEKELAENMMIVDLVRNDLSRSCATGTVQVEEMFGIYGFKQVWQMISTVTGALRPEKDLVDALQGAFPMGSMTGAPKISAMKIIESLEATKRGLYSGSIGYIKPNGDCDFNVVIRSIQYNASARYLSFMVGSAITYDADPAQEYEECLLKAKAMMQVLIS